MHLGWAFLLTQSGSNPLTGTMKTALLIIGTISCGGAALLPSTMGPYYELWGSQVLAKRIVLIGGGIGIPCVLLGMAL